MTSFVNDDGDYLEYSGDDFGLTKECFSILNFNVKGDVSFNFELQATSTNKEILGYSGPMQFNNPALSNTAFSVVRNGNIVNKGYIVIQRDLGATLDCFFFSGNANWFDRFDFSCKDIRNADYTVPWTSNQVRASGGVRSGICWPLIDWLTGGQRFSNRFYRGFLRQGLGNDASLAICDFYPCLYMHTMVEELCKIAGIKMAGNLLTDGLYLSLIVTPSGPDIIDPATGLTLTTTLNAFTGDNIPIGAVAPDLNAFEVIKWLIVTFGCIPTYDIYSNTLTLDLTARRNRADARDWSSYFKDFTVEYDKISEHNYIRSRQGTEQGLIDYNANNALPYGDLDIQSEKNDGSVNELYSGPFLSVRDVIGTSALQWGTPDLAFFKCVDSDAFPYASVSNSGGEPLFISSSSWGFTGGTYKTGLVFRSDGPVYAGYHFSDFVNGVNSVQAFSDADYISNDTGNLYSQKITKVNSGPRVLINNPATDTNFFTSKNSITINATTGILNVAYAYYSKVQGTFSGDPFKVSLSYGDINTRFLWGKTIRELYYNYLARWITSPYFRGRFLLPESELQRFNFEFVYLNTAKLSGYFQVGRIYGYDDSRTLVEVDLYSID